jgi:hypothetical protein
MFRGLTQLISAKFFVMVFLATCCLSWTTLSTRAQTRLCGHQAAIAANNGEYNIQNNEFNSSADDCIRVNGASFAVEKSLITSGGPGGYPSIYKGCHWGVCTLNSGLPVQVSTLSSLRSDWSTTQTDSDAYVVAYDIWFNMTPSTPRRPDGAELMIWLNNRGDMQPAGRRIASRVRIGGAAYDVWFDHSRSWNYIAYVRSAATASVSNFDLKAFIKDAVERGYIQTAWYLISVEAGFELWQGGTGLASNSFSVTVKNNLGSSSINIWWPKEMAVLSGLQPFKARLAKLPLTSYQMYWSVDEGKLNLMTDNNSDWDHKEATVDFSSWTWRDAGKHYGPFRVTFTVEDLSGAIVRQKTIKIYAAK